MFQIGLLLVTASLTTVQSKFKVILNTASKIVKKKLYIHFQPGYRQTSLSCNIPSTVSPINKNEISSIISCIYCSTFSLNQALDIRILLGNLKNSITPSYKWKQNCEVILTDHELCSDSGFRDFMQNKFSLHNNAKVFSFIQNYSHATEFSSTQDISSFDDTSFNDLTSNFDFKSYDNVVIGGTFDHLHNGHKILFTESILRCNKSLTIGITDENMIKSKILCETIEPLEQRMNNVRNFLQEVDPTVSYIIVPICDPFGPSIVDPNLQCIVVSDETIRGGQKVNEEREKKGLSILDIHSINLYPDETRAPEDEEKISSSSLRKRLLGTLIRPPKNITPKTPYLIGLTGGIASGKSNIAEWLEKLGAGIIDCDKLGHRTYIKGTKTYHDIVAYFGENILNNFKEINRKELGKKVFGNKKSLEALNRFTWPEVKRLALEECKALAEQGKTVIVLDAAVLIEAGWDNDMHEVWVTIIPKQEAINRIIFRDHLSEENARERIESQISNEERVAKANVILCSLWSPEVTKKQVEKAWEALQPRLSCDAQSHL